MPGVVFDMVKRLKPLGTRLDGNLLTSLKVAAAIDGRPMQDILDEAVRAWLSAREAGRDGASEGLGGEDRP